MWGAYHGIAMIGTYKQFGPIDIEQQYQLRKIQFEPIHGPPRYRCRIVSHSQKKWSEYAILDTDPSEDPNRHT